MSIDYYPCDACGDTFPDCGHYGNCACEKMYCGDCFDEFCKKYGTKDDEWYGTVSKQCPDCSLDEISNSRLLSFLLKKHGWDRALLEAELRNEVKK
jgi:hypothetical protein